MGRAGGLGVVAASAVVAIEVKEEGRFPNRPYGNDGWERYAALGMAWGERGGNDTTGGPHLFVLFVSGGSCLELIRFGNRIGAGLIDFVPEID